MADKEYSTGFISLLRERIFSALLRDYPTGMTTYEQKDIVEKRLRILLEYGDVVEPDLPDKDKLYTTNIHK